MASFELAQQVADAFGLGHAQALVPVKELPPGREFVDRASIYRLQTDRGEFAVHHYSNVADVEEETEQHLTFERDFFAAGLSVAEPVVSVHGRFVVRSGPAMTTAHRWVDHISEREAFSNSARQRTIATNLGRELAKLHGKTWRESDKSFEPWVDSSVFPKRMKDRLGERLAILESPPKRTFEAMGTGDVCGDNVLVDKTLSLTLIDFESLRFRNPLEELARMTIGFDVVTEGSPAGVRRFNTALSESYFGALDRNDIEKTEAREGLDYFRLEALADAINMDYDPEIIKPLFDGAMSIECIDRGLT